MQSILRMVTDLGRGIRWFFARRTTIAVSSLLAGAVAALMVTGQLTSILACGFDWTVVWTAVQAIAISVAAVVALGQLHSYLSTEQGKNTILLFQELDSGEIGQLIYAVCDQHEASRNVASALQAKQDMTEDEWAQLSSRFQDLANLFDRIALQYKRRTINRDMYLRRMEEITLKVYYFLKYIQNESSSPWSFSSEVKELIHDCISAHAHYPLDEQHRELLSLTL